MEKPVGFFSRLALAFAAFFAILGSERFARSFVRVRENGGDLPPAPVAEPPRATPAVEAPKAAPAKAAPAKAAPPPSVAKPAPDHREALQLLALLQREGRLVDFLKEDIAQFPDADVGAAARVVHDGCRKVVTEYVTLEPIYDEGEGATIVLAAGFDPGRVRLSGNVVGEPPFRGSLKHHGWRAADVRLPVVQDGMDPRIVAPAEVEL